MQGGAQAPIMLAPQPCQYDGGHFAVEIQGASGQAAPYIGAAVGFVAPALRGSKRQWLQDASGDIRTSLPSVCNSSRVKLHGTREPVPPTASRPIRKIGGSCKCRRNAAHPRGYRLTSSKSSVKRTQEEYLCALGSPSTTSWACIGKMKGAAGCCLKFPLDRFIDMSE